MSVFKISNIIGFRSKILNYAFIFLFLRNGANNAKVATKKVVEIASASKATRNRMVLNFLPC